MPTTEFGVALDGRTLGRTHRPSGCSSGSSSTSRHRFRLVLEDLRELPDSPLGDRRRAAALPDLGLGRAVSPRSGALSDPGRAGTGCRGCSARGPLPGTSDGLRARANATDRDLLITALIRAGGARAAAPGAPGRPAARRDDRARGRAASAGDRARAARRSTCRRSAGSRTTWSRRRFGSTGSRSRRCAARTSRSSSPASAAPRAARTRSQLTLAEYEAISAAGDRSPLRRPTP